jgi:hypothetical protein
MSELPLRHLAPTPAPERNSPPPASRSACEFLDARTQSNELATGVGRR